MIKKSLKFIIVFFSFLAITLPIYYYMKHSRSRTELARFSSDNINMTCQGSKGSLLNCMQGRLSTLMLNRSPLEFLYVIEVVDSVYQKQYKLASNSKDQSRAIIDYAVIYSLINSYAQHMEISRQNIDFIQIILLPFFRTWFYLKMKNITKLVKDISFNKVELTQSESNIIMQFNKLK